MLHALLLVLPLLGSTPPPTSPQADAGRVLVHSTVLDAPLERVWKDSTTAEGIVLLWGVAQADVDFRAGGAIRTHYDAKAKLGGPGTIVHHILAYEPERMIATKVEAPSNATPAIRAICESGWNVMRFEALAPDRTRFTIAGYGYIEGPLFDEARAFFDRGNAWVLERMAAAYADAREGGASDEDELSLALALVRRFAGGDWIFENTRPDGGVFRSRSVMREIMGGRFVVADGWLGDASGMTHHGHTVFFSDLDAGRLAFTSVNDDGTLARGHVRAKESDVLALDWNVFGRPEQSRAFYVEMRLESEDRYRFRLFDAEADALAGKPPLVEVLYRRVESAPQAFLELKAS